MIRHGTINRNRNQLIMIIGSIFLIHEVTVFACVKRTTKNLLGQLPQVTCSKKMILSLKFQTLVNLGNVKQKFLKFCFQKLFRVFWGIRRASKFTKTHLRMTHIASERISECFDLFYVIIDIFARYSIILYYFFTVIQLNIC